MLYDSIPWIIGLSFFIIILYNLKSLLTIISLYIPLKFRYKKGDILIKRNDIFYEKWELKPKENTYQVIVVGQKSVLVLYAPIESDYFLGRTDCSIRMKLLPNSELIRYEIFSN